MLEDTQILRLITASVKLQEIIVACKIDREYLTSIDFPRSRTSHHLKDASAKRQGAKAAELPSQPNTDRDLCTSLVKTIHEIGELVSQHRQNTLSKPLRQSES
jgi:hypothetical protein